MNRGDEWRTGDPYPPIFTVLEKGGPQDRIRIRRNPTGWEWAHNNDNYQPCTHELLLFWGQYSPLRVIDVP
jgi:hypothetical protein